MARRSRPRPEPVPTPTPSAAPGYFELSMRPLAILAVLLPLIVFYELASARLLDGPDPVGIIAAKAYLADLFASLGAVGRYLPSVAILSTLLAWHLVARHPWGLRPGVVLGMPLEAAALAMPLLVLGLLLDPSATTGGGAPPVTDALMALQPADQLPLHSVPWHGRLAVAIGAGLYEEFLFRMAGLALMHTLFFTVLRLADRTSKVFAVLATAVAFALYHDITLQAGQASASGFDLQLATFYTLAGVYLGVVYLIRGLGLSVLTHATYNAVVLLVLI